MLKPTAAIAVTLLLAGSALAQTSEKGRNVGGVVIPPNYGLKVPVYKPAPATNSTGGVRAVAPRRTNPSGVRAAQPGRIPFSQPTKASIPFTRLGPTARTADLQPQQVSRRDRNQVQPRPLPTGDRRLSPTPGMTNPPPFEHNLQGPLKAGFVVRGGKGKVTQVPWWYTDALTDWSRVPTWGVVATSGGLFTHGTYDDGKFRLRFRTGSPLVRFPGGYIPGGVCSTGSCGTGYCDPYYYSPTIYGSYLSVGDYSAAADPQLAQAIAPEPAPAPIVYATEAERGMALLHAGQSKDAALVLRDYLAINPHDAAAMRALGLALAASGNTADGVAMINLAYRTDPALAADPLHAEALGTPADLRRILERISVYANRVNLPSGWLTLAALMQAEGRNQLATRMVERARQAGLEPEIATQMNAALRY